jgi:hypothetical protein
MPTAGLKTIIALSFVLAVGFLLVILSCALWGIYYPLLVVATFVLAPLPNWLCGQFSNPDDFVESSGSALLDLGRFWTGFLVVMGIGTSLGWSGWEAKVGTIANVRHNSSPDRSRPLEHDCHRRPIYVCHRRFAHLRDDHQLWHVLPGGV